MLHSLFIKNFALIDDLKVSFSRGFSIITGETGAGKSILLDALSLVLGKRADLGVLRDLNEKCIIEAEFLIENYNLKSFFEQQDIDYDPITLLRREILPSGKSRAFINDSPVTLDVLSKLSKFLMDIHSQNDTQLLINEDFQLYLLDILAENEQLLLQYKKELRNYKNQRNKLKELEDFQKNSQKEYDYNSFILEELQQVNLESESQQELEETYEQASNIEEIKQVLSESLNLLSDDEMGAITQLRTFKNNFEQLSQYGKNYENIAQRFDNIFIELDDLNQEIYHLIENIDFDPKHLQRIQQKLKEIYRLEKKHQVSTIQELLEIQYKLEQSLLKFENIDKDIENQINQVNKTKQKLEVFANEIHKKRVEYIPFLKENLQSLLYDLGMPNAQFQIELSPLKEYTLTGNEQITFLFSANKGGNFGVLKKVASGGELSRIMLAVKSILAQKITLPTIIFDEIDTGVSGEIAHKMANIMKQMSKNGQIFSITHLPQVASKGDIHYKVFKEDIKGKTITQLKVLSQEERINEIAQMLGGKIITETAREHAKQLLNNKINQ